ncbi:MAG: membrane protein insertion efficiency factor YidD [Candidatus Marinimicrobia bacterium]|nr:membrane protein insertion efficiency factor YidD [Candidatus Neomarinimicrobiota bacterium]
MNKHKNIAQLITLGLLRIYRLAISPFLGSNCRFYPSCSVYSIEAVEKYGVIKGGFMSIKRISKCHPFHTGGVDLVP